MKRTEFERIYETYVNLSHKIAFDILNDYHLAMDVSQELFVRLYKNMDKLDEKQIKYWILCYSKRIAIDHLRKLKKEQQACVNLENLSEEAWVVDTEGYIEEQERREELVNFKGELFEALVEKDPEMYDVVTKLIVEEQDPEEVAESKNITIGNLRTRLYRTRKWLQQHFGRQFSEL